MSTSPRNVAFSVTLTCLLVVALLTLAGCGTPTDAEETEADKPEGENAAETPKKKEEKPEKEKPKKKKERSTSISAAPVTQGVLVIPVVAEGSIRARHTTEIKFEVSGKIERVWVREGQRVRKGQKLVTLDNREYLLALEEARSRFLQALGQLAVEEEGYDGKNVERSLEGEIAELEKLERDGVVTRRQRLDRELELGMEAVRNGAYRRELLEVRSGLSTSRADIERQQLNIEKTIVTAPFSGVITGLNLSSKEHVQTGQQLARLVDNVNVEVEVGVLESDLTGLEVGKPARVTIPALGETLSLKIDVISPEIDETSRTCRILMRLQSEDGRVKPGMYVRAAIAGQIHEDRKLVPREAILTRDGRPMLFKVDGDRAKWVYVQLGMRNEQLVEIARIDQGGPLDDGTLVVVDNHLTLTHDAKIKVKKTLPIPNPWVTSTEKE